jgi:hypothetical protein
MRDCDFYANSLGKFRFKALEVKKRGYETSHNISVPERRHRGCDKRAIAAQSVSSSQRERTARNL